MSQMFSVLTITLVLSTGWWGALATAVAEALGLDSETTSEQPAPPRQDSNLPPTPDSGCSWDPWGGCYPRG